MKLVKIGRIKVIGDQPRMEEVTGKFVIGDLGGTSDSKSAS